MLTSQPGVTREPNWEVIDAIVGKLAADMGIEDSATTPEVDGIQEGIRGFFNEVAAAAEYAEAQEASNAETVSATPDSEPVITETTAMDNEEQIPARDALPFSIFHPSTWRNGVRN